jgi:hypothetical protein
MADSTGEDRWSALAADLGIGGPTPNGPPPLPTADGGPPKRRRRRRSRKSGPGEGGTGEPLEGAADIIDPGETREPTGPEELSPDGTLKKRRRRRSRRKVVDENGAPNGVAETVAVAEADHDDDEAAEPVSVANLPSWQELIDGLYRP